MKGSPLIFTLILAKVAELRNSQRENPFTQRLKLNKPTTTAHTMYEHYVCTQSTVLSMVIISGAHQLLVQETGTPTLLHHVEYMNVHVNMIRESTVYRATDGKARQTA